MNKYALLAVFTTAVISAVFMHQLWLQPNDWLFSRGGDGLQTYYQSIWHVQNDTSAWHQSSMNYPFGESIFFTGGQPLFSNVVRWIKPVIDLSDHMVAITNLSMLLSALLCTLFLYLIFQKLKFTPWIALGAAVVLTFTTQQWERMGGHYTLAWLFAVPGMIYFLMHFYEKPGWKKTAATASFLFILGMAHLYYIIFFLVIAAAFLFVHLLADRQHRRLQLMSHFIVQAVLPLLIIQLMVAASSHVHDRTSLPWGFMEFRSYTGSYLFPYGMWYEHFFDALKPKNNPQWEGLCYIGGAAWIMLIVLVFTSVLALVQKRIKSLSFDLTDFSLLMAVVGSVALSFAFPFNYGREDWLKFAGPLQQFRGIGRFAFVAFFPLNILLLKRFFSMDSFGLWWKRAIFMVVFILGLSEGIVRLNRQALAVSNERMQVLRINEEIPQELKNGTYQAILPLPYFHVGSENVWLADDAGISTALYNVSLALKIPTFAAMMSRTSVSQTFQSIALTRELMEPPALINQISPELPILVIADTSKLSVPERMLISHAEYITQFEGYSCYELRTDDFVNQFELNKAQEVQPKYPLDQNIFVDDSAAKIYFNPLSNVAFSGKEWTSLAKTEIPDAWHGHKVWVSFWIADFARDLIPRANVEIIQKSGDKVVGYDTEIPGKRFVGMSQGDGLIEYPLLIDPSADQIEILMRNQLAENEPLLPFSLLMRPDSVNCSILRDGIQYYNNRRYN